jgi:MoaA/NifB/PqqE/SkfB family radical SAM enzyme
MTIEQAMELFPIKFVQQLDKMFMCGVYGDPAAGQDTLKIFQYFKKHNPNITIGINTNGSIRNPDWWIELASLMTNKQDYAVFSIDGLEDTNHIYRQGVQWDKIIKNVSAFINAGGNAQWEMIVFEYNQHQIVQALELAKELNFSTFKTKVSRRYNRFPIEYLKPPTDYISAITTEDNIDCFAMTEKSIYVDAHGRFMPCCLQTEGNINSNVTEWFNSLISSWDTDPDKRCKRSCTKAINNLTTFKNQWTKEFILR